jgi:O-Antigen ligase
VVKNSSRPGNSPPGSLSLPWAFVTVTHLSRKKEKRPFASRPPAPNPPAESARRLLLALVTALVVARPVVLGEDPGLLYALSGTSGLTLSMLWLIAAAAWAAWQGWFRREDWSLQPIELGLAAIAALVFLGAIVAAHYRHPALLIGWEWSILVLVFFLVRQLFRTEADVRGLLAALLATGVSLSAQAAYQHFVELPRLRAQYSSPEQLSQELAKLSLAVGANSPSLDLWRKRIGMDHVFATYAHPNGFAGLLALVLPAAVVWSAVAWRGLRRRPRDNRSLTLEPGTAVPQPALAAGSVSKEGTWAWRPMGMVLCTLLLSAALWWTHSRGAILGVVLAGGGALVLYGRDMWWAWRGRILATLTLVLCLGLAASRTSLGAMAVEKATHSFGLRTEYWAATWRMISEHPWLGVGAGNFGRVYPRYMAPEASEKVQDPHNLLLEIWASAGVVALAVFLLTLAFLFRHWSRTVATMRGSEPAITEERQRFPWEICLGGVGGLFLGGLLRVADSTDVLNEALLFAGRGLVWCAAYAVFAAVPWPGRSRPLAIMTGVAALLLNLCVSGGIAWPSVAQPLWIMAALALATAREAAFPASLITGRLLLIRGAAFALLAGTAVSYLLLVFVPVTAAAADLAAARRLAGDDADRPESRDRATTRSAESPGDASSDASRQAARYLAIVQHLEAARKADPGDVNSYLELAYWYGQSARLVDRNDAVFQKAVAWARLAQKLDPDGKEGFLAEYSLLKARAAELGADPSLARRLAGIFQSVVDRDPTEAALHAELAQLYQKADQPAKARLEAEQAVRLDGQATTPARRLEPEQRSRMEKIMESDRK